MRPVRLPPDVGGRLYLAGMPGRQEPFEAARAAIVREQVEHVVCLAGPEEVREASPGYHAALLRGVPWRHIAHPVPDLGVPPDRPAFCGLAKRVADRLREGSAVMIHCRAGIGRSGLLAVAVLMALGRPRAEAALTVRAAGAGPETDAQERLLDWIADAHRRVADAYDRVAPAWHAARAAAPDRPARRLLEAFAAPLPAGAAVLDVGCGSGVPVARYLTDRGYRVTGLDASPRLLDLAALALPATTFVHGDMRVADPGGPFDGVVAWDSVFHLPRPDHAPLFGRLAGWLRPGGRLLLSLGGSEGEFTAEMLGEAFYFAGHEPATAVAMLTAAGFDVEHWEVDDPGSRGHIAVLARRAGR